MKKIITFIISLVLFLTLFTYGSIYANSDFNSFKWEKLNHYYTGRDINSVANNGTIFIAVGERGIILKSLDGAIWKKVYSGYEENIYSIIWDGKAFNATAQNGQILTSTSGDTWRLLSKKVKVVKKTPISTDSENGIFQNKLFGFSKRGNIAVAVGESGAIYYGTKGKANSLKQGELTTESHIIDKLGNAVVLYVGESQMYIQNNFFEKGIPKPYIVENGENKAVYVPLEEVINGIGGACKYDGKSSTIEITYNNINMLIEVNSKTLKLNGKEHSIQFPAVIKNNTVFIPLDIFTLLGKQTYFKNNLIVISDIKNFLDKESEQLVSGIIDYLSVNTAGNGTSLSEKIIDALIAKGIKLYSNSDKDAAIKYFEAAEYIEPNSELYNNLGEVCKESAKYNKANYYLDKGLEINQRNFNLYKNKNNTLKLLGRYDQAMKYLEKAAKMCSEDIYCLLYLAEQDFNTGHYDIAISRCNEVIKKDPGNVDAYYRKAMCFMYDSKYKEAADCWKKIAELDNDNVDAFYNTGMCLSQLKRCDEAVTEFNKALKLSPNDVKLIEKVADALARLNKFDEAVFAYKKAIKVNPFNKGLYGRCGEALESAGKYDEALALYDTALETYQDNYGVYQYGSDECLIRKIKLLLSMGKYEQMINDTIKYEDKFKISDYYYYMALGYCSLGNYDEAMKYVKKLILLNRYYREYFEDGSFDKLKERSDYKELTSPEKIYMDDTFRVLGADFFENSMFKNTSFKLTDTLGNNADDKNAKDVVNKLYANFLNNNIKDIESAVKFGFYKDSPILEHFSDKNLDLTEIRENFKGYKQGDFEIILCGSESGKAKYAVVQYKTRWTFDGQDKEEDDYCLLIKDNGIWKYYYTLY